MEFMVFQLQAPLAAWGDTAVGEFRPTSDYPGRSALLGLLAAALGIRRSDEVAHAALGQCLEFAIGIQSAGKVLRDYHTAQVAPQAALKKRPQMTRRDELAIPRQDLTTILSTRAYRQNVAYLVAVRQEDKSASYPLAILAEALIRPRFTLYLGRKSCPLAAPAFPQIMVADSALAVMQAYVEKINTECGRYKDKWERLPLEPVMPVNKLAWGDSINAGTGAHLSVNRKDAVLNRQRWQFGDRTEHIALLTESN